MIIGNEKQKKFLIDLLRNFQKGTIVIFGPEGVGKFSFLKEIVNNYSSEVIFINSEDKFLKIDTARAIASLGYKKSTKRIIVVNDAHKFQISAQNTLLKTFEESPSDTIFILITHRFYKILPTIRSRGIIVRFNLVSRQETIQFLKEKGYSDKDIELVVDFYGGQPGKALKFLEEKTKFNIFKKFISAKDDDKLLLIEELKNHFSLSELLEKYLLFQYKKMPKSLNYVYKLKNILNLYEDSLNYSLNFDIQLVNLILNNG